MTMKKSKFFYLDLVLSRRSCARLAKGLATVLPVAFSTLDRRRAMCESVREREWTFLAELLLGASC